MYQGVYIGQCVVIWAASVSIPPTLHTSCIPTTPAVECEKNPRTISSHLVSIDCAVHLPPWAHAQGIYPLDTFVFLVNSYHFVITSGASSTKSHNNIPTMSLIQIQRVNIPSSARSTSPFSKEDHTPNKQYTSSHRSDICLHRP